MGLIFLFHMIHDDHNCGGRSFQAQGHTRMNTRDVRAERAWRSWFVDIKLQMDVAEGSVREFRNQSWDLGSGLGYCDLVPSIKKLAIPNVGFGLRIL